MPNEEISQDYILSDRIECPVCGEPHRWEQESQEVELCAEGMFYIDSLKCLACGSTWTETFKRVRGFFDLCMPA